MTVTFQVGDREFGGAGNLEIDFWVGALLGACFRPSGDRIIEGKDPKASRSSMNVSLPGCYSSISYSFFRDLPVMITDTLLCSV